MKVLSLSRFLEEYRETIRRHVIEQFRPRYTTAEGRAFAEKLSSLKRRPFAAQIDAIAGVTLALDERPAVFLVGEMGVGKSLIATAAAYLMGMKNTLVLCPPHLVHKWEKEITCTLPSCEVIQVRSITGLRECFRSPRSGPRFFILSRERAKLSYRWKPAAVPIRPVLLIDEDGSMKRALYPILACPVCFAEVKDTEGIPLSLEKLSKRKYQCLACRSPLWEADRSGVRRYAIADFIKRRMKGCFDLLILDEVHEYKAKGSAQGMAAAGLARAAKKVVALTGTLFGGYSTTLFHLLYRFTPEVKRQFCHNQEGRWAARYGILERITKSSEDYSEDGAASRRRKYYTRVVERPGVSPEVMFHLIDKAVFMRLSDLAVKLPPYQEEVLLNEMEPVQKMAYQKLASDLLMALREQLARGNKSLLGAYLQTLLSYPDQPFREEVVINKETGEMVARAPALREDVIYPKERRLIDLVKSQLDQGRNVLLYVTHTEERDLTGRIHTLFRSENIQVGVLKSHTVPPEQREGWIQDRLKEGLRVLITNPRMVQTGLDLIDFPTIIYYELEYSVYTLRQASRRSWRIGQHQPVKIYFMAYQQTLQEKGLRLIAAKVRSALAVEGELLDTGISAFNEDQDFFLQLARSIVEKEPNHTMALDGGVAHQSGIEKDLDQFLSGEESCVEVPASVNGNGAATQPTEPEATRKRDVPGYAGPTCQAPLLASLESPDQLSLF